MSKYIQSFYQYPVTFSSIGKTVPARGAQGPMKNLAEVSDAEFNRLQNSEPLFRELVNKQKYRVLNHIPAAYVPAAQQVNEAKAEAEKMREENERLRAELEKKSKPVAAESNADDGLEGERGRDAVAGVDEEKKTNSSKKGKK